jgi:hypothetical protein
MLSPALVMTQCFVEKFSQAAMSSVGSVQPPSHGGGGGGRVCLETLEGRCDSVDWGEATELTVPGATGCTTGVLGFDSRRGLGIFLFTASRTALEPTQPPIQWISGSSFLGDKAVEAWSWPLTSIWYRGQNKWTYTFTPPIRLHGVVLT